MYFTWFSFFYFIDYLDWSLCIAFFTFEFVARFFTSPAKCAFMKEIGNLIDILAVIPYYFSLGVEIIFMKMNENSAGVSKTSEKVAFLALLRVIRILRFGWKLRNNYTTKTVNKKSKTKIRKNNRNRKKSKSKSIIKIEKKKMQTKNETYKSMVFLQIANLIFIRKEFVYSRDVEIVTFFFKSLRFFDDFCKLTNCYDFSGSIFDSRFDFWIIFGLYLDDFLNVCLSSFIVFCA